MGDAQMTVGMLYRGTVRRFLAEAKFYGQVQEWTEVKGFLDSRFLIKGASAKVIQQIMEWVRDVNTPVNT